ncbi:MAG TPA: CTP synthase [Planctomycetota bacterium]|nr:CTP synthase [Planctomycetota bacterium]
MTKHIFVTGGVVSSLGKGLTAASLGCILENCGLRVRMQKFDPYINVDPGTMNPYQHGEVYVLDDGSEMDLDLGHYERFTHAPLTRDCNFTTGKIYQSVIRKERAGEYLGQTVQVVPHITDEIKAAIDKLCAPDVDVVITEIGGTVGDIESLPFLEAIRQYAIEHPASECAFIHLTLLVYLPASGELKTKPTQQSVGKLREIGIQPDILICRTTHPVTDEMRRKISLFCNVRPESVIEERDVAHTIYEVPLMLRDEGIHRLVGKLLDIPLASPDLAAWERIVDTVKTAQQTVEIAVVGKYIELNDAYKSIYEAIGHAAIENGVRVVLRKLSSDKLGPDVVEQQLAGCHGILVPGGFGGRGVEGKILAARIAREQRIPYLGLCYGLHMAVIEFARNVCGLTGANSTEIDPGTPHPVIALLDEQQRVTDKGGTMRLGAQPCRLLPGRARSAYGKNEISERHRHRYEVNNSYRALLTERGMAFTGLNPKSDLVEIAEIPDHPWFVSVQYHPEFKSKPTAAHPLFRDFVKAALARAREPARRAGPAADGSGDPGARRPAKGKRGAASSAPAPSAVSSRPPTRRAPGTSRAES